MSWTKIVSMMGVMLAVSGAWGEELRLNDFQMIGTHNSYHLSPTEAELQMIARNKPEDAKAVVYSNRTLTEQLNRGIRQFELDLWSDPSGRRFAHPMALRLASRPGSSGGVSSHDPAGKLLWPGAKVLHAPHYDFRTTVLTLKDALEEMGKWSEEHPDHHPVMVILELKGQTKDWTNEKLKVLEAEVLEGMSRERLLTPDDVRGDAKDLRSAVVGRGWPEMSQCQGKFLLMLDNEGEVRDGYVDADPILKGRLLFPSCESENEPAAGWFKLNNVMKDAQRIRQLVESGFLVRTRSDVGLKEGRENDPTRRDLALKSGAQFVSTDFPEPKEGMSDYQVVFEDGGYVRRNPVTKK
ncbi:hypothetical protein HNR46_001450 [Haloferula luteola]|uniref:Calcium-dependent phosphoinositide phospholipase C n=1 Tax=Haloferula luteola TaxID=595692 RepID=A0A840V2E2_9BACT|nr:Ca2+-dependent phosphoinositide-specific phospholipase C [Haloferula luteola]MBB5351216.1 hypothetical protein [Haloferula luteola]